MISRSSEKNVFAKHWEWFVAIGGVAALAASVVFNFVLAEDGDNSFGGVSASGKKADVAAVSLERLEQTMLAVKAPRSLADVPADKGCFLASEFCVFCASVDGSASCGRPIPFGVDVCPYADCGVAQKQEEKPMLDTDGDGLTDEYEKLHGLDPKDSADAEGDIDGDGFTNIEEFEAGTSPSDKDDHPDYLDSLKVELPLKQTFTTLTLTGAYKTPSGMKINFKDPKHAKDYSRGVYSVYEGGDVGETGFVVKSCELKTRTHKMGGGMTRREEYYEAQLERKADKKVVRLVQGVQRTPVDEQAKVVCERGGHHEFYVVEGQEIDVNGWKYKVLKMEVVRQKGVRLTLQSVRSNKERVIEALEQ